MACLRLGVSMNLMANGRPAMALPKASVIRNGVQHSNRISKVAVTFDGIELSVRFSLTRFGHRKS